MGLEYHMDCLSVCSYNPPFPQQCQPVNAQWQPVNAECQPVNAQWLLYFTLQCIMHYGPYAIGLLALLFLCRSLIQRDLARQLAQHYQGLLPQLFAQLFVGFVFLYWCEPPVLVEFPVICLVWIWAFVVVPGGHDWLRAYMRVHYGIGTADSERDYRLARFLGLWRRLALCGKLDFMLTPQAKTLIAWKFNSRMQPRAPWQYPTLKCIVLGMQCEQSDDCFLSKLPVECTRVIIQ